MAVYKNFLKLKKSLWNEQKPAGSDGMGAGAKNNEKPPPDMMLYFNILLSNEEFTTLRVKYTWLDSFSFAGGFIDLISLFATILLGVYNYKINQTKIMYHYELVKAKSLGKLSTAKSELIKNNYVSISIRLWLIDNFGWLWNLCMLPFNNCCKKRAQI
jgi:hypothetical protein